MDILVWLVLLPLLVLAGSVCGVVALQRTAQLRARIARLEAQLVHLQAGQVEPLPAASLAAAETAVSPVAGPEDEAVRVLEPAADAGPPVSAGAQPVAETLPGNLERNMASRWMVWVGGIALALAGVFLVQFGIYQFGPRGRIGMGLLLGIVLMVASEWLRRRSPVTGGPSTDYVPPALAGGGAIALYASVLAGFDLYGLLPAGLAFALLALVSGAAMALALLQGPFLAALGILGAYLVPMLVSTGHGTLPGVLSYVAAVTLAALGLQRWIRRPWLWWGTVVGHFAWLLLAQRLFFQGDEAFVFGFVLLTLYLFMSLPYLGWRLRSVHARLPLQWQRSHGASRLLTGLATLVCGCMIWLLALYHYPSSGLLTLWLLALFLTWLPRRAADLDLLPWLGLLTLLVAFLFMPEIQWRHGLLAMIKSPLEPALLARQWQWSLVTGLAMVGLAFWRLDGQRWPVFWRPGRLVRPGLWASLLVTAPLVLLAFCYARSPVGAQGWWTEDSLQWPMQALLLFLLCSVLLVWRAHWPQAVRVALLAGANGALILAFIMVLQESSLTLALAVQMAVLARLAHREGDLVPRWLIKGMVMLVIVRLSLNPWLLQYPLTGLFGVHWTLYGYGVPVLACGLAARWLPPRAGDATPRWLEAAALHLLTLWLTLEERYWLSGGDPFHGELTLADTSIYATTWGLLGLIYGWKARLGGTLAPVYRVASPLLLGLMMAVTLLGSSLHFNPVWHHQAVGSWPILNLALLGWGGPALLAAMALGRWNQAAPRGLRSWLGPFALLAGWGGLTLLVRQFWHGNYLNAPFVFDAEQYAYSAVWLGAAVLLMWMGDRLRLARIRQAALLSVALAVLKIFLWDMAGLEGLYRVASFLGLGLCMVGLGWFYQHHVVPHLSAPEAPSPDSQGSGK